MCVYIQLMFTTPCQLFSGYIMPRGLEIVFIVHPYVHFLV